MLFPVCNIITFFWTIKEWFSLCSSWIYCASRICKVFPTALRKFRSLFLQFFSYNLLLPFKTLHIFWIACYFPTDPWGFQFYSIFSPHSILKIGWFLLSYFELQFFPPNLLSFPICCSVQVILKFQLLYFLTPQFVFHFGLK